VYEPPISMSRRYLIGVAIFTSFVIGAVGGLIGGVALQAAEQAERVTVAGPVSVVTVTVAPQPQTEAGTGSGDLGADSGPIAQSPTTAPVVPSALPATPSRKVPLAADRVTQAGGSGQEVAVRAAAAAHFAAYSSGDYGASWDLWSVPVQRLMSRADYIRLFELCPQPAKGIPFTIEHVRFDGSDRATVWATRLIATIDFVFVLEGGAWRYLPSAKTQEEYRIGVDRLAAQKRAAGQCGPA
jgi:hypothetical protein